MTVPRSWAIRDIDLVTLRLFAATAEEGSLALAAKRENITISSISRRITSLEAQCGVTLLERHDRGVVPTQAGEMLLERVRAALRLLEQMILDMESIRGGTSGQIRVFSHMSSIAGALPDMISAFMRDNPAIEILIEEGTSIEVIHAVSTGLADIGVFSGTVQSTNVQFIHWIHDELVVILQAGHALLAKKSLILADILNEPFIGMQRDSALLTLYRHQAAALGQTLHERAHATSFDSVRKLVSVGLGVSIVPVTAVRPFLGDGRFEVRPLDETWAVRPLMLCVRQGDRSSAAARLLIQYLTRAGALVERSRA